MKYTLKKLISMIAVTSVFLASTLQSTIAKADDSSTGGNTHAITNGIATAIGYSTINILSSMYSYFQDCENAYNTWIQKMILANAAESSVQSSHAVEQQAAKYTDAFIFDSTTAPLPPNSPATLMLPKLPSQGVYATLVPVNRNSAGLAKSGYLSSGSLFSNTKFSSNNSDDQQAKAAVFIQFLADAGNKVTPLDAGTLQKADPSMVATYLTTLGNYNAGQSVGLNALMTQYNERIPLPQLNGESALSYDEKQALLRMQPAWIQSVSKMTIVDVARETLYTQAEMNYQMFQLRMQLEQLNATLATMQMQQAQLAAKPLVVARKESIIQAINSASSSTQ